MSALTPAQVDQFIDCGFVRLEDGFPADLAAACRATIERDLGCDPADPSTWTEPVIRLPGYSGGAFAQAVNTPKLHAAFDQLVGAGNWHPKDGLGTFPIRFPVAVPPPDAGWHIDVSYPAADSLPDDYSTWRVNVRSRGRARSPPSPAPTGVNAVRAR